MGMRVTSPRMVRELSKHSSMLYGEILGYGQMAEAEPKWKQMESTFLNSGCGAKKYSDNVSCYSTYISNFSKC